MRPVDPLRLETEAFIEGDGPTVVSEDGEFEPAYVQPSVGLVGQRRHQGRANSTPGMIVMDGDADGGGVGAPGIFIPMQGRMTNNPAARHGDDVGVQGSAIATGPAGVQRREWQLSRSPNHPRLAQQLGDAGQIFGFAGADADFIGGFAPGGLLGVETRP